MITFYPGPSKVYPVVEHYLKQAFDEGVLSINHRSQTCMQITRSAIELLHQKLHIPEDYTIYFVSSATEVWEIIAQSLTQRHAQSHRPRLRRPSCDDLANASLCRRREPRIAHSPRLGARSHRRLRGWRTGFARRSGIRNDYWTNCSTRSRRRSIGFK